MTDSTTIEDLRSDFRAALIDEGWLLPSEASGLPGFGPDYLAVFEGLSQLITSVARRELADGQLVRMHFPPLFSTRMLEKTEYVASFPQLLGTINSFHGGNTEFRDLIRTFDDGGDWQAQLGPTGLALTSAACHPLYSHLEGRVVDEGKVYELTGTCFRHEPSEDPMRMVSFRMREYVLIGTPEQARAHRERWLDIARSVFESIGLEVEVDAANDPFFGRAGAVLAAGQLESQAKFELLAEVYPGTLTAIGSANYHETHFGAEFDLRLSDGSTAHSACSAFGLDRIVLALVARHGTELSSWPQATRAALGLERMP
jgi:seryl-tRNA synthetase